MSGPSRLPENVRALRGARPPSSSLPEQPALPSIVEAPAPPDWVKGDDAVAEFNRLAAILTKNGMLNDGNVSTLGHYAMLHGAAVKVWRMDPPVFPPATLIAQLRMLAGNLGIIRVNFGASGAGKVKNPFAEHAASKSPKRA